MELILESHPHAAVIRVNAPRIDAPSALGFKEDMRAVTGGRAGRFILDLHQVTFVDSSGLGAIVAVMKQLQVGQTLELAGLQPMVAKVFRLTRMDTVFTLHDSVDLAHVRTGP